MSCNRTTVALKIPEFFETEELGVAPARSCRKCRGCRECSYRGVMISGEKEIVVRRVEDQLKYDDVQHTVTAAYPWTEDIIKLTDNLNQVVRTQRGVENRLLKDSSLMEAYNCEIQKFIDRGAISKVSQHELDTYAGPVSYVTHHPVMKPDSLTTLLRVVTNSSFINEHAKISPNGCMPEGPNALASLLGVLIGFRLNEVPLGYDLTKAYQSIKTGELERVLVEERFSKWRDFVVKFNGTIPKIYGLVGLTLKVMVASGDTDEEILSLLGKKVLGHIWKPTEDQFIFKVSVNLTPAKFKE